MKQCNTPILFLLFNRPDTTQKVFDEIRKLKPQQLFVAADGSRKDKEGEEQKCTEVRDIILNQVDWDCELKTLFRSENMGCGPAVNSAITWFFENVEEGIILEDDCLPDPSFFPFCEELLIRYKNDDRIGIISGNNHVGFPNINDSYVFSKFKWIWGWATWKRAWKNMDLDLTFLQSAYKESIITNMGYSKNSYEEWINNILDIQQGLVNTWDYHWFLSLSAQNQLCIFPRVNLVANIGFGQESTHCKGSVPDIYTVVNEIDFPLCHPKYMLPNYEFENLYQRVKISQKTLIKRIMPNRVKRVMKLILRTNLKNNF
jgi:hypothetical protein